jgi:predicted nucleic acid-binding protein
MSGAPIFVDSNAIIDFFVGEEALRKEAIALRKKFPEWVTLPWCRYEFGNVLRRYIRARKVEESDATAMLRIGVAMLRFCDECPDDVVLAEANASHLTFYDAAYVACARAKGISLYTRDREIIKNCPDIAIAINDI